MDAFVLGVVSSLLATALTVAGGWLFSMRSRQWPVALLSRLTGLGVRRVFARQHLASSELAVELARARWVRVLAGRGNELTRDGFAAVWEAAGRRLEFVQVLLPDADLGPGSWLSMREEEMRRVDLGFSSGLLAEQVRVNAAYVNEVARHRHAVSLRFYDLPNMHRVIITDKVAYLTIYRQTQHGRNSPCMVARRPGLMYDYALLLFNTAWDHSRPTGGPVNPGSGDLPPSQG
ncbi:hypothetical protein FHS43_002512 [Streptosporangium becharense]|uniref:Uncharacterized protein n=1 Tax=Streptosporangium becharense TaxID=1816182 RepID=A0A7W9MI79_9ACTN|nr:hypothetical protein [Streptosporangium becharense]MBB2911247.1 hypothetical protein [Streptosporangium becharense]MBB5821695.1 hypothetical protein [Streptosporangium becharense]